MSAKQHSTLLGKVLVALKYISLIVITLVCLAPIILAAVTNQRRKCMIWAFCSCPKRFILKIISQHLWMEIC